MGLLQVPFDAAQCDICGIHIHTGAFYVVGYLVSLHIKNFLLIWNTTTYWVKWTSGNAEKPRAFQSNEGSFKILPITEKTI